jgi:hypothetical protein
MMGNGGAVLVGCLVGRHGDAWFMGRNEQVMLGAKRDTRVGLGVGWYGGMCVDW